MQARPNTLTGRSAGRRRCRTPGHRARRRAARRRAGGEGPVGRGEVPPGCRALLLCVPDAEIARRGGARGGSGALRGPRERRHPARRAGARRACRRPSGCIRSRPSPAPAVVELAGAGCAVAGSTPAALGLASDWRIALGMEPFEIDDGGRARLPRGCLDRLQLPGDAGGGRGAGGRGGRPRGHEARALLAPLVRRTVENWVALGPERALTGPVARGDDADRRVPSARRWSGPRPSCSRLFDELLGATRALAERAVPA